MRYRLTGVCVVFLSLFFIGMNASAKWKPEYAQNSPEVQRWFNSQHNARGEFCCNETDGHRFDGTYSFNTDGSVTAIDNGMEYRIAKDMVLSGHNPTGGAVWWYLDMEGGRRTYCFSPGSLT